MPKLASKSSLPEIKSVGGLHTDAHVVAQCAVLLNKDICDFQSKKFDQHLFDVHIYHTAELLRRVSLVLNDLPRVERAILESSQLDKAAYDAATGLLHRRGDRESEALKYVAEKLKSYDGKHKEISKPWSERTLLDNLKLCFLYREYSPNDAELSVNTPRVQEFLDKYLFQQWFPKAVLDEMIEWRKGLKRRGETVVKIRNKYRNWERRS
ncbi:MAG TPA: hypothetical protein VHC95_13265 [Opitutales bacterium]|nr:hypothetical protein [Opitutales bacterium]